MVEVVTRDLDGATIANIAATTAIGSLMQEFAVEWRREPTQAEMDRAGDIWVTVCMALSLGLAMWGGS